MSSPHSVRLGDVYWIRADALRPSVPGSTHPHVVLQANLFNASRIPTTVVCAVTTNLERAEEPGNVILEAGEANLPQRSVAVVSRIAVVDKADLGVQLGTLPAERVDQILSGLSFQQKSFFDR